MNKPIIFFDMDGVVADFVKGYKDAFGRNAYQDDPFTINQFCQQIPEFFRLLSVLDKGYELVDLLKDDYQIVFLTTPMPNMPYCKRDKVDWIKEHFGPEYDVIFSDKKEAYVSDEKSILIDDMEYNLKPWADAGGTAIDVKMRNDDIIDKIEEVILGKKIIEDTKKQLKEMKVDKNPTEKQKESGNYKKGDIVFKGIKIKIENVPGSIRFGLGFDGKKWMNKISSYYGYITGTEGADLDPIDVYIGPKLNASRAFVINQNKIPGVFDEHKVVLGCETLEDARQLYLDQYSKGWESHIDSIVQTNTKKIRDWLKEGNLTEPFKVDFSIIENNMLEKEDNSNHDVQLIIGQEGDV